MSTADSTHNEKAHARPDSPAHSDPSTLDGTSTEAGAPDLKLAPSASANNKSTASPADGEHEEHENPLFDGEKGLVPGHVTDEYPDGGWRAWRSVVCFAPLGRS